MGYSTEFSGVLVFKRPITMHEYARLKKILGEDCRDHPEWQQAYANKGFRGYSGLTHIDLEVVENTCGVPVGLQWDGSEKTYDLVEKINLVIVLIRDEEESKTFGLSGYLMAQGEGQGDVWKIGINKNGWAECVDDEPITENTCVLVCRHCGYQIQECTHCGGDL